jgi:hypothetical protein
MLSAKLTAGILSEHSISYSLESNSVYGASILMPQIARSAGWSKVLTLSAVRSFVFLALNFFLQLNLLSQLEREESVMDGFAGQVYLCDFGRNVDNCPGGAGCKGPGGTDITAATMYSFPIWNARVFVRDSLKLLFPDKAEEIHEKVQPGEYGLESARCRFLCCFLFMVSMMSELVLCIRMAVLLYKIPTSNEPWISLEEDEEWDENEDSGEIGTASRVEHLSYFHRLASHETMHKSWLDGIQVKVAGMPAIWKGITCLFVLIPKLILWQTVACTGITFLMETSQIDNIIINSMALAFILEIDELICTALMPDSTRRLLDKCGEFHPPHHPTTQDDGTVTEGSSNDQATRYTFWDIARLFPTRLVVAVLLTVLFVYRYYLTHCVLSQQGAWISKAMFLPKSTRYGFLNTIFPFLNDVEREDEPYWEPSDVAWTPPAPFWVRGGR